MSTCYVLEGGAMRGNFTGGVLDFLATRRMPYPDVVIGVSAGAICGVSYCSGQVGRAVRVNSTYCTDRRFLSLSSFLFAGDALGTRFMFDKIMNEYDPFDYEGYAERPMEFWVVCTDVTTGKPVYHRVDELPRDTDYIRASSSMPIVSRIVEIDGRKLLDGGSGDSIPVHWALDRGYDKIVVILTQDREFKKQPESDSTMRLMHLNYREYPEYIDGVANRYANYNKVRDEIFELEREGRIFVFAPEKPVTIKQMENNPAHVVQLYDDGWQVARHQLDAFKAYLTK